MNCRVVSNDEMRDHHFNMLHAKTFTKWKERHIIHFEIPWSSSKDADKPRPINLLPPLPYSHAMQESTSTGAWHLPRAPSEGAESEAGGADLLVRGWVCLRPLPTTASAATAGLSSDW